MRRPTGEATTVAGAFVAYGLVFLDRLAPLFLVGLVAADLGVPSALEGTLALLVGLGWATAMPVARLTSGRLDDRTRIVCAALLSVMAGLGSSLAGSWLVFVLLRGLGGLASGSGAPAVTSLVFASAPADRRGRDLGIVQSATRLLGSLAGPVLVTAVAVASGWRWALRTSSGLLLLGAIVLVVLVPRSGATARAAGPGEPFRYRPGGRRNVVLCVVGCVLLLCWLTVWSQTSVGLVREWLDLGPDAAGRWVGLFGIGAGAAALLVPLSSDRLGRRRALGLVGATGGLGGVAVAVLAAMDVVPPTPVLGAVVLLAGAAMGGLPLVISIIPAEAVATGDVGRALLGPIAGGEVLGSAALPALAGWAAAPAGRPVVLLVTACGVLLLVGVALALRPLAPGAAA